MKNLRVVFIAAMFSLFSVAAQAQPVNVGTLLAGLVNVNVEDIDIDISDVIVVNIEDSEILTDFEINILNNAINNNEIASRNRDFLNDLEILTDSQIVVGILNGKLYVVDTDL